MTLSVASFIPSILADQIILFELELSVKTKLCMYICISTSTELNMGLLIRNFIYISHTINMYPVSHLECHISPI